MIVYCVEYDEDHCIGYGEDTLEKARIIKDSLDGPDKKFKIFKVTVEEVK